MPELVSIIVIVGVLGTILLLVLGPMIRPRTPSRPRGSRPPDGLVELIDPNGVSRTPNAVDPRFGRFEHLDTVPGTHRTGLNESRVAPNLLGDVVLWTILVGRDGTDWSEPEIADVMRATERAAVWIEKQAIRWNAGVNLRICSTYFVGSDTQDEAVEVGFQYNGEEVGPSEHNAEVNGIASASRVASKLGFRDLVELISTMQATVDADVHAWVVQFRRQGLSFAVPPDTTLIPGVSLAFCYLREASFSEPIGARGAAADPVTIAHELLHLFGASDKYGVALSQYPTGQVTRREIMRLDLERLSELRIDRLTAVELGWIRDAPQ